MTKKEWLKAADKDVNDFGNSIFNASTWMHVIKRSLDERDDIVFTSRNGLEYSLKDMLGYVHESIQKASKAHDDLAELAKGLIHSVPDDFTIGERKGLFE